MNFFTHTLTALLLGSLTLVAPTYAGDGHGHGHDNDAHDEPPKGPHNGRLLQQDGFALEVSIFETGVPPEYRLYAYANGKPLQPQDVNAQITLQRLGGAKDVFTFKPEGDYLLGIGEVREPHSFFVTVNASYNGRQYQWQYDSPEGRTQISARAAAAAGITTAQVGPAEIHETLDLFARIELLPQQRYRVAARYPGIVQSVTANIGDRVAAGDVIASIENSNTLQHYTVKAPASGVVLQRYVNRGDAAGSKPLLLIGDLSTVAVDMSVFAGDRARLAAGQTVIVRELKGDRTARARIDHIADTSDNNVTHVHATLDNTQGHWQVGDAVRATVQIATHRVEKAVRSTALQEFRGNDVVFAQYGDQYELRMLQTGRRDSDFVEVLDGIDSGTPYVVDNSYLVKADVLKSGASHDH